ncbi:MAG: ABC transporter permease, partial [Flavobacteriales bacterium]|nr:ABC transporter permease [Flavobacteriales bacterium]
MQTNKFSLREIMHMAWDSVVSQRLRTGITASIIAIGITALVGILTSVAALRSSMMDSFASFGANVVNIYG